MIVGVGYEGRSLDEFLDELERQQIDLVVDVRLNAVSRKAGFSGKRLAAALQERSIAYRHEPTLGNPKENRAAVHAGAASAGEIMRRRLDDVGADAIDRLAADARARRVAVLCVEADEARCHRAIVIAAVLEHRRTPRRHGPAE